MPYSIATITDILTTVSDGTFEEVELGDEKAIQALRDYIEDVFRVAGTCPYCNHRLRVLDVDIDDIVEGNSRWVLEREVTLYSCPRCAYWQFYERDSCGRRIGGEDVITAASSKLSEYSENLPDGCEAELAKHIRANPDIWHNINPERLERLVASIIQSNYQHCEVIHTGRSGDGGKDIVFIDDNNEQWLVQVKRRGAPRSSEGIETFRNLLGAMFLHGAQYGVFVSTADHFTTAVHDARKKAESFGRKVEIVDKGRLDRIIGRLLPRRPWLEVLEHWSGLGEADEILAHYRDALPPLEPDYCWLKLES